MFESREFTFKFGDTELTVQNSTDQLFRLISDLQNKVALLESGPPAVSPDASEPSQYVRGESRLILWIDDRPGAFERTKFQKDGFNILQSISTADALQKSQEFIKPDIVIYDMGRTENGVAVPDAGLVTFEVDTQIRHQNSLLYLYQDSHGLDLPPRSDRLWCERNHRFPFIAD